ncbi:MAG: DNA-binding protein WhiA [Ruminococcus sp.]|nr:DNA-binding protein WhiA [Ruminococcus sp.]
MSEISFSRKVKDEIISKINSTAKADACLYGLLLCTNVLDDDEILLLTETEEVADFFSHNVERICSKGCVSLNGSVRGSDKLMYSLTIDEPDDRKRLLDYFCIKKNRTPGRESYPKPSLISQMISGMFLSCGSISDPNKRYHMEFSLPNLDLCNMLGLMLLEQFDLLAKHVERKNRQILYFKESEHIIDMVTLMGATSSSFDLMNVKIYKDMRNNINRGVNCVNANIEKSIRAAQRQIEDIELIDEMVGLDTLPDGLREMAILRYENPDFNLSELGEALNPPISRSGANHRLQRIAKIAQQLRDGQE